MSSCGNDMSAYMVVATNVHHDSYEECVQRFPVSHVSPVLLHAWSVSLAAASCLLQLLRSVMICCGTSPEDCRHHKFQHSLIQFDETPANVPVPSNSSANCTLTVRGAVPEALLACMACGNLKQLTDPCQASVAVRRRPWLYERRWQRGTTSAAAQRRDADAVTATRVDGRPPPKTSTQ